MLLPHNIVNFSGSDPRRRPPTGPGPPALNAIVWSKRHVPIEIRILIAP